MRRLIIYILVCVALCACSESNSEVDSTQQKVLFNVEVSAPDTRTQLVNENGKYKAIWKAGDYYIVAQIAEKESSFCTGTVEADTPSIKVVAEFEQTEGSSYRYLFASPNLAVSADCTTLGFPLPSRQSPQGMDTFDGAADVILSDVIEFANQPSDQTVTFNTKRVSAVGKVSVKNVALAEGDAVRSIIFACEHPLAGDVTNVVVEDIVAGNDPLTNSIIESASNTITVMLHEPQTDEFTCFFSCLPATLAAGESYIVTLNTEQNHSFVKQAKIPSDLSFTSGRMTTFTVNMAGIVADAPAVDSANCQILYTSTDGNVVTPYATDVFGATIVSNTYENGQGVITFDGEVTKIGGSAFRGCTNLKTLNIPNSVTSIERWAFLDCDSLEEFFGSNIISNGRAVVVNGTMIAFAQGGLTSYALPSEVTAVDVSVFESCDKLTEISLGENINTIGGSAFDSCIGITSIIIPQSVTTIGNNAFHSCTKLGTVYVESATPPTGEDYMFNNNAADRKIYVPAASVEAYKAADGWSDYADAIVAEGTVPNNEIWYTSTDGAVVTPYATDVFGANITSNTYENGQGVIKFDGDVTKIGNYAFSGCSSLTSVTIPNSTTSLGECAFNDCDGLTSFTISDSVDSIGNGAFYSCSNLASITIGNSVTSIGATAFCFCDRLTIVTIPESVTAIGNSAFQGCINIKEFNGKFASTDKRCLIVDGVLNSFAPADLAEYTIPDSVTAIGNSAFYMCSKLTSVTIPDSVTQIGNWAFQHCSSLTSITIPDSVITLGGNPFWACTSLAEFNGKFASEDKHCLLVDSVLNSFAIGCGVTEYTVPDSVTSIGYGAFRSCNSLTSINIPNGITSIDAYAFENCTYLKTVTCAAITPPTLGGSAFRDNAPDRKIYVPAASVEAYKAATGWSAYADAIFADADPANCQILYTSTDGNIVRPYKTDVFGANIVSNTYENGQGVITFDSAVTSVGNYAFYKCRNLTSVTIPNGVTLIGNNAFDECSISSIIIPDGVESIGTDAFIYCHNLTEVHIPQNVITLGGNPFRSCNGLAKFSGKYASADGRLLVQNGNIYSFAQAGLVEYTITEPGVNTIGWELFRDCESLVEVTIPQTITKIDFEAFYNCSSLKSVYCRSTTPPILGSKAFGGNATDRKIYVPASSVEAYKSAQHWSDYADAIVAEVDKPANNQIFYTSTDGAIVTPYDMSAFGANIVSNTYENGLGIIIFDGEVTKIGTDAFCGCQNLTSIVIGDKVTFIGVDAFSGCNNLASVSIPSNVTSIGRYAFCGCSSLVSVTIPNSITTINLGVFKECSNLKSVTIPNSITEIGVSAFSGCSSLTSVTIPDSVLSIGDSAFSECSSLISINIPNSINTLGANPFKGCSKLAEFNGKFASSDKRCLIVEGELNSFASADIIEYTIPYNTTSIGFWAFEDCCNLQLVTIPNSVTLIKNGAFMGCKGLISITIPDSITSIWDYAFRSCNNLRSVYCKPITPPSLGSYVFASSASDCKIYVPAAYVETYKWVWSEYADSIVAEGATSGVVDLSVAGTANCYLVNGAGSYKFKAVKGNSLENFSNGYSADVLWESFGTSTTPNVGDLITNVAYKDGYISFSTPATFKSGNASVALRDSSGKILWSWHIWCSAEGWNDQVYPNNAGTMMDRNLGATSATPGDIGAFGLLYQWGRKDPFMGTCAMSESTLAASTGSWDVASSDNMDFAVENPMTLAKDWFGGGVAGEGWHTSESEKGLYDPCPVGYRLPDGGDNGFWATALGTSDATSAGTKWDSTNYGHHWTLADETTAWYPAVGYRSNGSGALRSVGSDGYYWSASPYPSSSNAYNLYFDTGNVFPASDSYRGYGYSVRCVRE